MAREGRNFEQLIERLEKWFLPEEATITSPKYFTDQISGSRREVDIAIEYKLGTTDVLVIIECRDRKDPQDSTWIEQIATKVKSVGANKAIAVSSSGFYDPAIKVAKAYGIDLRTFQDISHDDVKSWLSLKFITQVTHYYQIKEVSLKFEENVEEDKELLAGVKTSDKILTRKIDGSIQSLNWVFEGEMNAHKMWDKLQEGEENESFKAEVEFTTPEDRYQIDRRGQQTDILAIFFHAHIAKRTKEVPLSSITSYSSGDDNIVQTATFEGTETSNMGALQISKDKDGNVILSTLPKKEEP